MRKKKSIKQKNRHVGLNFREKSLKTERSICAVLSNFLIHIKTITRRRIKKKIIFNSIYLHVSSDLLFEGRADLKLAKLNPQVFAKKKNSKSTKYCK